nr:hypothetical protein GCM10025699_15580 [Microbacterium flavescens]
MAGLSAAPDGGRRITARTSRPPLTYDTTSAWSPSKSVVSCTSSKTGCSASASMIDRSVDGAWGSDTSTGVGDGEAAAQPHSVAVRSVMIATWSGRAWIRSGMVPPRNR